MPPRVAASDSFLDVVFTSSAPGADAAMAPAAKKVPVQDKGMPQAFGWFDVCEVLRRGPAQPLAPRTTAFFARATRLAPQPTARAHWEAEAADWHAMQMAQQKRLGFSILHSPTLWQCAKAFPTAITAASGGGLWFEPSAPTD